MSSKIIGNNIPWPYGSETEVAVLAALPEDGRALVEEQLDPTYLITVEIPDGRKFTESFCGQDQTPENIATVLKAKINSMT